MALFAVAAVLVIAFAMKAQRKKKAVVDASDKPGFATTNEDSDGTMGGDGRRGGPSL